MEFSALQTTAPTARDRTDELYAVARVHEIIAALARHTRRRSQNVLACGLQGRGSAKSPNYARAAIEKERVGRKC